MIFMWERDIEWMKSYFGGISRFGVVSVSKWMIESGISWLFVFEIPTVRHRRVSLNWRWMLWVLGYRTSIDSASLIRMLLFGFTRFESDHRLLLEVFRHVGLREIGLFWLFHCFRRSCCSRALLWFSACRTWGFRWLGIVSVAEFNGVNWIAMTDTWIEILWIHVV